MAHALMTIESVATIVIAVYVASIGTFQWFIAREKLRLDLYNRRFDVYVRTLDIIQALLLWSSVSESERLDRRIAFVRAVRESRFLFASEPRILVLLEEINQRSFHVSGFVETISQFAQSMPDMYIDSYEQKQASLEWIMASPAELERLMSPFLAFRHRELKTFFRRRRP